jgi:alkylmercury lyase
MGSDRHEAVPRRRETLNNHRRPPMTDSAVGELADALNVVNPFLHDDERRLALAIYELLAEGRPVPIEKIAQRTEADPTWVGRTLDDWTGVFRDDDGRVIAFWGLGLIEMPHTFERNGRTLYTWCAWDPLFIAPLLGSDARVTSTCPVTGRAITLYVGPGGVRDVDPPQAVLSFLRPSPEMRDDVIESFCHYVLLFASRDAADVWIAEHPGTFVLDLEEAFDLGQMTLGRLHGRKASPARTRAITSPSAASP